jgi:hypothetical protein
MSLSHGAKITRDGLICHLDFINPKCWSGFGSIVYDLSGNGYNGSVLGAGTSISGGNFENTDRTGAIQLLDGNNGNDPQFDFSGLDAITVEVMFKRNGTNDYGSGGDGQPSFYQGIFNYYWTGGHQIYLGTNASATSTNLNIMSTQTTLDIGDWVHVVGVTGPNVRKAYVNGKLVASSTSGSAFDADKRIYLANWDSSWGALCTLNNFKMYNRELNHTEITNNYNALRSRVGL